MIRNPMTHYGTNLTSKFRKNNNDTSYDRIILGAQNSKNCFVLVLESSSISGKILNVAGLRIYRIYYSSARADFLKRMSRKKS